MADTTVKNFFGDSEKMRDFHTLSKEEFLEKNPDTTLEEYEATEGTILTNILKQVHFEEKRVIDVKLRKPFSDFWVRITPGERTHENCTEYIFSLMCNGCYHTSTWCGGFFKSEREAIRYAAATDGEEIVQYINEANALEEYYENL